MKQNLVAWFEIPVSDMDRAKAFYEEVFKTTIDVQDFGGTMMGFFPSVKDGAGAMGSLIHHKQYVPSKEGVLIYFNCEDVETEMARVEAEGGNVLQPKTLISPATGYMAVILDTEGNRIALYSHT